MGKPVKIAKGQKYGFLTVIKEGPRDYPKSAPYGLRTVIVQCVCGNRRKMMLQTVRSGNSKSCGCKSKVQKGLSHVDGKPNPLFNVYRSMIRRCHNPKDVSYDNYGRRGIRVCRRWRFGEEGKTGFECFMEDMGPRPKGKSIDRKNNDKGYFPDNCRWASNKQQTNNVRTNSIIILNGKSRTVAEWSAIVGIKANTITCRMRRGWSGEKALTIPIP